ncbi:MAG: type IV secretory system conjugative DNA transfer family protein [Oscillospiraceae bacterium]
MSGWGWIPTSTGAPRTCWSSAGSGAAKTRSYVKPNILEANTNYVITDPKSEVLLATGRLPERAGTMTSAC